MKCNKCGFENPENFKFCENCGNSLGEITCLNCSHSNPIDMKFCEECGSPLDVSVCPSCSHENPPGFSFCEECGSEIAGKAKPVEAPRSPPAINRAVFVRVVPKKRKKPSVLPFLFKSVIRSLAGSAFGFLAGRVGMWAVDVLLLSSR